MKHVVILSDYAGEVVRNNFDNEHSAFELAHAFKNAGFQGKIEVLNVEAGTIREIECTPKSGPLAPKPPQI